MPSLVERRFDRSTRWAALQDIPPHHKIAHNSMPRSWLRERFTSLFRDACCAAGWIGSFVLLFFVSGCGTTKEHQATEQLLLSDAVDRSVSTIDFRPLSGEKVYLDTSYLRSVKSTSFVNADYVTSALRQQVMAAGCFLQDSANEADIIIEARIGTLGYDDHRVTFGVPENSAINSTVSLFPSAPSVPQIPEIALARRDAREGAAKVAAFAYDRETREAIWQSGISQSRSTARDTWVMGVGPFQGGSIRDETRLAGTKLVRFGRRSTGSPPRSFSRPPVDYTAETRFDDGWPVLGDGENGSMIGGGLLPGEPLPEIRSSPVMVAESSGNAESETSEQPQGEAEPEAAEKIASPPESNRKMR